MKVKFELEYSDRRKKEVMVEPSIFINGIGFYSHQQVNEKEANAICQVLHGELHGRIEDFKVVRIKRTTTRVEMTDTDLEEIRMLPPED